MSDLYARLLARTDPAWYGLADDPPAPIAALRAVVEFHAPIPCGWALCRTPETHRVCKACGSAINSPCSTIRVIADALGVTDQELIEKEQHG